MNSQFKNSNLGFYLYAAIIVFITAASIIVFWYMIAGYRLGTYPEDTILGSVYIGGLKEDDVKSKVEERISRWLNDETVVFELAYQGYTYEFDRELFFFDVELSAFNIKDGKTNTLFASYQGTDRNVVINEINALPFLDGLQSQIDMDQMIGDILSDAGFMKSYSSKNVEDYFIDIESVITEVGSSSLKVFNSIDVDDLIDSVYEVYPDGKIVVNSKELFDVLKVFGPTMSDDEITVLSTGMMELLLATNFSINEVHYNPNINHDLYTINNFPYLSHNAKINRVINQGFSFYNPNESDYYFTIEKGTGTDLNFSLNGLAFVNDITVSVLTTPVDYITQTTSDPNILQFGYVGAIVEVTRVIEDVNGNVIYNNIIVFEYYPPVKQILLKILQMP